jgi:hypothetical protein
MQEYACEKNQQLVHKLAMHVRGPRAILTLCESGGPSSAHATKQWVVLRVRLGLAVRHGSLVFKTLLQSAPM